MIQSDRNSCCKPGLAAFSVIKIPEKGVSDKFRNEARKIRLSCSASIVNAIVSASTAIDRRSVM